MHRKTISITDEMEAHIRARVDSGDYANDSEYIRDLIRRDKARREAEEELRALIQEGIDSGPSDKSIEDIWQEVLAEREVSAAQ